MWANAQWNGRPPEYRWRPLFNAAKFGSRPLLECRAVTLDSVAPSVQRRKVWLTPTTRVPCSNAGKTRKPLRFAGVPQSTGPISAAGGPKFTILWAHVEKILLLNNFFPIVDMCPSREDIARQSCAMVPRWRFFVDFLRPEFSASRVQQVSDLHLEFD